MTEEIQWRKWSWPHACAFLKTAALPVLVILGLWAQDEAYKDGVFVDGVASTHLFFMLYGTLALFVIFCVLWKSTPRTGAVDTMKIMSLSSSATALVVQDLGLLLGFPWPLSWLIVGGVIGALGASVFRPWSKKLPVIAAFTYLVFGVVPLYVGDNPFGEAGKGYEGLVITLASCFIIG